jgi:diaminopimelate epimerase
MGMASDARFYKYQALGNDYLVIDPAAAAGLAMNPAVVRLLCDRHFGVGSDGILYGPFWTGPAPSLRIFNPDGSEAEKSGNGLRIFSRYLFEHGHVTTGDFSIQTLGGLVHVHILTPDASSIRIEMGKVTFRSTEIPMLGPDRQVVDEPLEIAGRTYRVTCLSIGNPHCVIPMPEVSEAAALQLGPQVENHPLFPRRVNVQIVKVVDRHNLEIRIWERGAGDTLASGSSSCAAAAATHRLDLADSPITVHMPGGEICIEIDGQGVVHMTGPVEGVMEGTLHPDLAGRLQR